MEEVVEEARSACTTVVEDEVVGQAGRVLTVLMAMADFTTIEVAEEVAAVVATTTKEEIMGQDRATMTVQAPMDIGTMGRPLLILTTDRIKIMVNLTAHMTMARQCTMTRITEVMKVR